ncbi:Nitroreductase [Wolfiporia cocos MD-104 SS10]|uniref:Nitroreductase n=1 Tax=Wolfiporia cocos (strain MD-104) TaxID=742152 RepID=A0A2H3J0I9_WOLCO|nr:Nitroreductase [Wolfiporia cocos MD-104 SS10]
MSSAQYLDALKTRRTYYNITPKSPIPDARIEEIVQQVVLHTPSSFNSQSSRAVVLLKKEHEKLWDIVAEVLKPVVPEGGWPATEKKLQGFKSGYGTVLFFEDQEPIRRLQEAFPLYQESFPGWSEHTSGMIQLSTWTALELEGFGASLQHYNPLIDQKVKTAWNIPSTWNLIAEMPFGVPGAPAGDKAFSPIEERVKVYGK